jgi:hypothetical protein
LITLNKDSTEFQANVKDPAHRRRQCAQPRKPQQMDQLIGSDVAVPEGEEHAEGAPHYGHPNHDHCLACRSLPQITIAVAVESPAPHAPSGDREFTAELTRENFSTH